MTKRDRAPGAPPQQPGSRRERSPLGGALAALACGAMSVACAGADASTSLSPGEDLPGGETTNQLLFGGNAFMPPAANATLEHEREFFTGNAYFNQGWVKAPASTTSRDGLGPLFNARSCAECHFRDGRGRPPLEPDEAFSGLLLRLSVPGEEPGGAPVPEPSYGGQLQPYSLSDVPPEGRPSVRYEAIPGRYDDGTAYELLSPRYAIDELSNGPLDPRVRISPRVAPAMIGLGLLEAIDETRLLELADPEDLDGDGISGRVQRVPDVSTGEMTVGRFGWKAEQPSVRQQSAGAFLGDLGVTSSLFPDGECTSVQESCRQMPSGGEPEISDRLLSRVAVYGQLIAVPARQGFADRDVLQGKALFSAVGCDGCHVPSHRTRPDAELEELADQLAWPYTDLLLHDMGEGLSDGRPSFGAAAEEWRTPPLWGLGRYPAVSGHDRLLHDGRARGVAEAILWHDGEGRASRDAFASLEASERAALVAFVESL